MHPAPNPGSDPSGQSPPEPVASSTPRSIPGRIGAILKLVQGLIAYGRYFSATANTLAEKPEFVAVARVFGTYNIATIMLRVERGIRRALALQRYLLARAARGRNLRFCWANTTGPQPHQVPPPKPPRAKPSTPRSRPRKEPSLLDDDDWRAFHIPTDEELDAEVKRRPAGLTVTYILLDLGIVPGFCDSAFFTAWSNAIRRYGGNIGSYSRVRERREQSFERERDRHPDIWHLPWRTISISEVRQLLGLLIGEPPPERVPAIVPS